MGQKMARKSNTWGLFSNIPLFERYKNSLLKVFLHAIRAKLFKIMMNKKHSKRPAALFARRNYRG
jgi:hypothetical protein